MPKYQACNTAKHALYMTRTEREVIYILNLIRMDPKLFAVTVLSVYSGYSNRPPAEGFDYYHTLMDTLSRMAPLNLLKPNKKCYESAYCQATTTGSLGYTGHDRKTANCKAKIFYNGECIDYGNDEALDILLNLMIDEGVPSLGHRYICIADYTGLGVSIQPHKYYRHCTVLDFTYAIK